MKKVLIVQNLIPSYRKGLFNDLSRFVDLTIIHSGKPSVEKNDTYKEEIIGNKKIWKFHIQSGLHSYLKKRKFDVVVCMFDLGWLSIMSLLFKRSVKVALWGHRYNDNNLANSIRNYLMKKAKANILYSDCDVKKMLEAGIEDSKIFIANNTIKIMNSEDLSFAEPKNSILYVGRAQKRKKIDLLIDVFHSIIDRIPDFITIDIVGSGPENEILKKKVSDLGISNRVVFHGEILDEDVLKKYFTNAIAYASPGPVGLGVLHSQSYGVPVITISEGLHGPELKNVLPNNGLICSDEVEFAQSLEKLCINSGFAKSLGHESFMHFSTNRSMARMVEAFNNAIQSVK